MDAVKNQGFAEPYIRIVGSVRNNYASVIVYRYVCTYGNCKTTTNETCSKLIEKNVLKLIESILYDTQNFYKTELSIVGF